MGSLPTVARAAPHFGEEPCISGTRGSGAIFFSGCSLKCVFCQNREISADCFGRELSVADLRAVMERLVAEGVHNINLVNPTHFVPAIARALETPLGVPVVYNTGGYDRVESLRLLEGKVDIYLPDLKYLDPDRAKRYSAAADYPTVAIAAIDEMVRQVGKPQFSKDNAEQSQNMIKNGVIVRHLVLPSHREDSAQLLKLLASEVGADNILLSLMSQYTPDFHKQMHESGTISHLYSPLCRKLTSFEYNYVTQIADSLGFDGYFQQRSSATKDYTPNFVDS
jgi:putative pyruvate formate lyase activating enzyme